MVFVLARRAPWLLGLLHAGLFGPLLRRRPDAILAMMARTAVMADRRVLARPEVGTALLDSMREAVRLGPRGILHELHLYTHPWGFRPGEIDVTVALWHGEVDPIVPVAHAYVLRGRLPHVRSMILPGEGHFSLPIDHMATILRALDG